jgi:hypothetical protein
MEVQWTAVRDTSKARSKDAQAYPDNLEMNTHLAKSVAVRSERSK